MRGLVAACLTNCSKHGGCVARRDYSQTSTTDSGGSTFFHLAQARPALPKSG
jgi:hypothetical protein